MNARASDGAAQLSPRSFLANHGHFLALMIAIIAYLSYAHLTNAFYSLFEGGGYMSGGRRIIEGQVPYRDFFLMYSPMRYYFTALLQILIRSPFEAQWAYYDSLDLVTAILAYLVVRRFATSKALQLLAPIAACSWCAGSERMIFPLACILLMAAAYEEGSRWKAAAAAVAAVCGGLTLQDLLPYTAGPVAAWLAVLWLLARNRADGETAAKIVRLGAVFVGAVVAAMGFVIALMAANHSLQPYLRDVYVIPLNNYGLVNSRFPHLFSLPKAAPNGSTWDHVPGGKTILWALNTLPFYFTPAVCIAAGLAGFAGAAGRRDSSSSALLLTALFGLCIFRAVVMRPDMPHLRGNALPAALCAVGLIDYAASRLPRAGVARRLSAAIVAAAAFGFLFFQVYPVIKDRHGHAVTFRIPVGLHARTGFDDWPQTWQTVTYVQRNTAPGDKVFYASTIPFMYVLTNRDNPTRYDYFDPIISPAVQDDAVRSLQADPPRLCVIDRRQLLWGQEFGKQFAAPIEQWIDRNYVAVTHFQDFVIYERRSGGSVAEASSTP